jgi:pilus assembly protein CpaD
MMRRKKKLFVRPERWPSGALIGVVGVVALLASCAPRTTEWSPVEAPKKLEVKWAEFHHSVQFAKTSALLGKAEKSQLNRFLTRVGRGQGVKITITAPALSDSKLLQKREMILANYLRQRGFVVALGQPKPSPRSKINNVQVTVGRHIVKTPTCPDWSKPATGDPANRITSNFGCATATNLGLMIADPGVLVHGTDELGPADGEAVARGISKYRKDAVKKPGTGNTLSIGGGN